VKTQVTIKIDVPVDATGYGMYQLHLVNDKNMEWITGISVHITGADTPYNPVVFDSRLYVDSQTTAHTAGPIQRAIDDWESRPLSEHSRGGLIMIYPIANTSPLAENNEEGAHWENLIMSL